MKADTALWSQLIELSQIADSLIAKVQHAADVTEPISREIPFYATLEVAFKNLPVNYAAVISAASDARPGLNIKKAVYENGSSRVYIRELGFQSYSVVPPATNAPDTAQRQKVGAGQFNSDRFPPNFRWNFYTSITQRQYCDRRVLARAGGNTPGGSRLAFKNPLVLEPRESFVFDCELLSSRQQTTATDATTAIIAMYLTGYREGF